MQGAGRASAAAGTQRPYQLAARLLEGSVLSRQPGDDFPRILELAQVLPLAFARLEHGLPHEVVQVRLQGSAAGFVSRQPRAGVSQAARSEAALCCCAICASLLWYLCLAGILSATQHSTEQQQHAKPRPHRECSCPCTALPCAGTGCRTATRSCPGCGARRCGWPASGRCSGAGGPGGATPAPAPPAGFRIRMQADRLHGACMVSGKEFRAGAASATTPAPAPPLELRSQCSRLHSSIIAVEDRFQDRTPPAGRRASGPGRAGRRGSACGRGCGAPPPCPPPPAAKFRLIACLLRCVLRSLEPNDHCYLGYRQLLDPLRHCYRY